MLVPRHDPLFGILLFIFLALGVVVVVGVSGQEVTVESQLPLTTLPEDSSCSALADVPQEEGVNCMQAVCGKYHLTEQQDANLMGSFDSRSMGGLTGSYYLAPYATSIVPSPLNSPSLCAGTTSSDATHNDTASSTSLRAACICQTSGIAPLSATGGGTATGGSTPAASPRQAIINTPFSFNSTSSSSLASSCAVTLPYDEMFETSQQCQRTTGRCPTEATCTFFEEIRRWDGDAEKVDGLEGFTDEEKRHYLEFAQGCYRLPQCEVVSSNRINTKRFRLSCPLCGSLGSMNRIIDFTLSLDGTDVKSIECSKRVEAVSSGSQFLGLSSTTSDACGSTSSAGVGASNNEGVDGTSTTVANCGDHGCCMRRTSSSQSGQQADQFYCQCYEDAIRGYWQGERCNECRYEYHASSTVPCRNRKSAAQIAFEQLASESALPMVMPFILFLAAFIVFSTCRQRWASDKEYHFRKQNDRLVRPDSANATVVRDPNDIIFKSKVIPRRPVGSRGVVSRRQRLWGRPNHQGPEILVTRGDLGGGGGNIGGPTTTTTTTTTTGGLIPPTPVLRGGVAGNQGRPSGHTRNNSSTTFSGAGLESSFVTNTPNNNLAAQNSMPGPVGGSKHNTPPTHVQPPHNNNRDAMPYSPAASAPPASSFAVNNAPSTRPNSVAPVAAANPGHRRTGSTLPSGDPGAASTTTAGVGRHQLHQQAFDPFDIEDDPSVLSTRHNNSTTAAETSRNTAQQKRRPLNHPPPLDLTSTTPAAGGGGEHQSSYLSQQQIGEQQGRYENDDDDGFSFA